MKDSYVIVIQKRDVSYLFQERLNPACIYGLDGTIKKSLKPKETDIFFPL